MTAAPRTTFCAENQYKSHRTQGGACVESVDPILHTAAQHEDEVAADAQALLLLLLLLLLACLLACLLLLLLLIATLKMSSVHSSESLFPSFPRIPM